MAKPGRPPGSKNKRNQSFLQRRLEAMYGDDFHPIMKIAANCVELQEAADALKDPEERRAALKSANAEWSRISEYSEPKLKSIEVEATVTHDIHEDLLDDLDNINNG